MLGSDHEGVFTQWTLLLNHLLHQSYLTADATVEHPPQVLAVNAHPLTRQKLMRQIKIEGVNQQEKLVRSSRLGA